MQTTYLGNTGVKVSRLCLGCMSYGAPERGTHLWTLSEDKARPFIKSSLDAGINFFDTANAYGGGRSESCIGKWLRAKGSAVREQLLVSSKVFNPVGPGPNGCMASLSSLSSGPRNRALAPWTPLLPYDGDCVTGSSVSDLDRVRGRGCG